MAFATALAALDGIVIFTVWDLLSSNQVFSWGFTCVIGVFGLCSCVIWWIVNECWWVQRFLLHWFVLFS
jgi:hypothetical protein